MEEADPSTKNEDSFTSAAKNFEHANSTNGQHGSHKDLPRSWRIAKDHPTDLIIGDVSKGVKVKTRSQAQSECSHIVFLSQIEPKCINDALDLLAMYDELNNFDRSIMQCFKYRISAIYRSAKLYTGYRVIYRDMVLTA